MASTKIACENGDLYGDLYREHPETVHRLIKKLQTAIDSARTWQSYVPNSSTNQPTAS